MGIPASIKKQLVKSEFHTRCCYLANDSFCYRQPQWHHVFLYNNKQIQEVWAILPACPMHHAQATPHNFSFRPKVKDYFEFVSLMIATPWDIAKYNKSGTWPQKIKYLEGQSKVYGWDKAKIQSEINRYLIV